MHRIGPIPPALAIDDGAIEWIERNCAGSVQGLKGEDGLLYWWFSNPDEAAAAEAQFGL